MKRYLATILVVCMLLCGCGSGEEEESFAVETVVKEVIEEDSEAIVEESSIVEEESSSETVEEAEDELIRHPLTGKVLEKAWTDSPAAITINNSPDALPHYGISQADILYELETEGGITRMFAVFTDLENVDTIGPVRSTRTYFNNIAASYDIPIFHCSGNKFSANGHYDLNGNIIPDWKHVDETVSPRYFFRDSYRYKYQGYAWEHTLFSNGEGMLEAMSDKGFETDEEVDYGLSFTEKPEINGESAIVINVVFRGGKTTTMTYNKETGLYEGAEYGSAHMDAGTEEVMQYRNVIVLYAVQHLHVVGSLSFYDLIGSGEGHFACDGKIIPIKWSRESIEDPFVYTLEDGSPLTLGVGNSYISIVSDVCTVKYE